MKIGILLPTSKLYPSLMMDFAAGLRLALFESQLENEVELVFESVNHTTDRNQVMNVMNKMVLQHLTDVNILFINYLLLDDIAESINALGRPTIVTNMGGNLPYTLQHGEFIFINDFDLCRSAFLSARWGVQKFGKKVAHGSYFYEAGYGMYNTFMKGLNHAEGEIIFNQISELNPDPNDFSSFMLQMKAETPDFLYMLYSERDAVDFLNKLNQSEENGQYPIVTSGVLLNDEVLEKVTGNPKGIYNFATWDVSETSDANKKFVENYKEQTGKSPNYFSLLAYESIGVILEAMKSEGWAKSGSIQAKAIKESKFNGPRGEVSFDESTHETKFEHHVYSLDANRNRQKSDSIGLFPYEQELKTACQNEIPVGWFQPYLCQ